MSWQFSIIDFTTNPNGITTVINEPVGWDGITLTLKRDAKTHGFFGFEDNSFSSLQYDGAAAQILRNAYYNYDVEAVVQLAVTYQCDDEVTADNLYLGQFDFTSFADHTDDRCYVGCGIFLARSYYLFKNRSDQQVDLDSLASFDQLPVSQTTNASCYFVAAGDLIGQGFGTIWANQLVNGLMPGSKITVSGTAHNNGTFTVASAKPDYTNVNPDLAGGGAGVTNPFVSATFDPGNNTISINQRLNIAVGSTLTITGTGNIIYGNGAITNGNGSVDILITYLIR